MCSVPARHCRSWRGGRSSRRTAKKTNVRSQVEDDRLGSVHAVALPNEDVPEDFDILTLHQAHAHAIRELRVQGISKGLRVEVVECQRKKTVKRSGGGQNLWR